MAELGIQGDCSWSCSSVADGDRGSTAAASATLGSSPLRLLTLDCREETCWMDPNTSSSAAAALRASRELYRKDPTSIVGDEARGVLACDDCRESHNGGPSGV